MILALALVISFQTNSRLTVIVTIVFLLLILKDLSPKRFLLLFTVLSLSAIGVFFTGMIFYHDQTAQDNQKQAIQYGLAMAARVYCFGILGTAFTASTEIVDLIYSLQQQLGLTPVFAYGLMAAFQMAPILPTESKNIKHSLQSRGINAGPFSMTFLIPLLVKSVRWSELLADAMTSRGFDAAAKRSYAKTFVISQLDWVFLLCCLAGSAIGTIYL
ncbi:hypothetical protein A5886_001897 [Enterococcus sp. 8G7_MSG3316]|uniref:Cobalt transport protein n=1 Tax=Candidatus Enterococcus testudinis TaxID=1834191 RepID=A0A242A710_9ENTE|nr:hypothetical protein A5886_001897 [Enterococcus sp. 8G7_MSG3316]